MPSQRKEKLGRKQYIKEFEAVLLHRRTATGWHIDPERLVELLEFLYPVIVTIIL